MQAFEVPRHRAALSAFASAFKEGLAAGEKELSAGAARLKDVDSVEHVDVPRDHVMDGEWQIHVPRFYEAGRRATLAARRRGAPQLDASQATEDSREGSSEDVFRWFVILNPVTREPG